MCVFSEVKGRVVLNGQPVANAVVERSYSFDADKFTTDSAKTDANGNFSFETRWYYSLRSFFPAEMNVYQAIWIHHASKKYEAWRLTKHRPLELDRELPNEAQGIKSDPNKPYDYNATYPKRKILLVCDLAQPASWKEPKFEANQLYGICTVVDKL